MFAPAKINLDLRITGTRPDGFHTLDSIVSLIGLGDDILVEKASETSIEIISEGVNLTGLDPDPEKNLAVRAIRLLEKTVGHALPTQVKIHKRIPLGGGLGGGSSDAATTLRAVNELWQLGCSDTQLQAMAAQLGSDVPLFLLDGTVHMSGRGEIVKRVPLVDPKPLWLVLVNDGTHCPTPQVYKAYDKFAESLKENLTNRGEICDNWRIILQTGEGNKIATQVCNDLEAPCLALFPSVARTVKTLQTLGCKGVRLSGSGATVFGLVDSQEEGERILAHPALSGCWRVCTQTLPDGVMAAHGPLTPIVMVRIHVGQPCSV